jgi:hypothetical protein
MHIMNQNTTTINGHSPKTSSRQKVTTERINYRSEDGLVEIVTTLGQKFPQHKYQIVCLRLRPEEGTRVKRLDGSGGLDICFTHREVAEFLGALNTVDGKANYRWNSVPEKPLARKLYWRRVNARRWGAKHRWN